MTPAHPPSRPDTPLPQAEAPHFAVRRSAVLRFATRRFEFCRFALPLLLALLAAAPLWGPGVINTRGGGDSPFLLVRTMEMAEILSRGVFPPRWMSHAAYDLGYPFFNHYASLPTFISAGLTVLGINVLSAIQATQTLGFILAALTMRRWATRIFRSETARTVAVAAYTFAPFHLVNVYVRGDSLSELYAFVWFPLILWALDRAAERPTAGRALAGGLAYSALILTHNVSALIFSPFALLYAFAALRRHRAGACEGETAVLPDMPPPEDSHPAASARQASVPSHRHTTLRVAAILVPLVVGFLLTAWFWLPAVVETRYGQMGPAFTEGYFHYSNHFRGLNLVQRTLAFDYSVAGTVEGAGPFAMGLVQALFAGIGAVVILARLARLTRTTPIRDLPVWSIAHLVALLVSTLMITPLSTPLWEHLPLLALTQFPWRFLSVQALFTATVTGAIVERDHRAPGLSGEGEEAAGQPAPGRGEGVRWALAAVAVTLSVIAALLALQPERLRIAPSDVTWERLGLYEAFTGNIGTTIRYEYLPADVVPRLYMSESVLDGVGSLRAAGEGLRAGRLVRRTPVRQTWEVEIDAVLTSVAFPLNWWPGWRATVDDAQVPSYAMEGSGRLTVDLPPGNHTVTLRLRPTPLQASATALSLISALVIGVGAFALQGFGELKGHPPIRHRALGYHEVSAHRTPRLPERVGAIAVVLGAALIGPLLLQRAPQGRATFFDFEQMPYPHRGPVAFADGVLDSVDPSTSIGRPGDSLVVRLAWDKLPSAGQMLTLKVVSPAEPRHGVDYAVAQTSAALETAQNLELSLPEDLARGLYLLQLGLADADGNEIPARTPGGRSVGRLYVGWLRVPEGPPLEEGDAIAQFEDIALLALETEHQPGSLRLKLTWALDPAGGTGGTPRNWRLSLRILDLDGRQLAQQDLQPGYGYLPTTLWQPRERVVDYAVVPLPEGLAPGDYVLRVVTYLQATMRGGGEADLPLRLDAPTLFDLRDACCELDRRGATILCGSDEIALLSLDRPDSLAEGAPLHLSAEWNALLQPTEDLQASWTVIDPSGDDVAVTTGPLAVGSATSDWPRHTWVRSPVTLDLPQRLDAGTYTLDLMLMGERSGTIDCRHTATFSVTPRPRAFTAPDIDHPERATFGETLELLGYDLVTPQRRSDGDRRVTLTLWWQARETPVRDYKRFVHLYDPTTEAVLTQDDAMPRDWTYPTTLWVAGEVVSETVTLDLTGIVEGTYRLGLGWYDPETLDRLPAKASDSAVVASDRVTLKEPVRVPR
jgi:hypothetical protein